MKDNREDNRQDNRQNRNVWDLHITLNSIFVALISFPLVSVFLYLSYALIIQAFHDPTVKEDIEAYIAVLGILSGPAYMAIQKLFERWNAEQDEYLEANRRRNKTDDDLRRAGLSPDLSDESDE